MKTLIIGNGEVGSSLKTVISDYHETFIRDIKPQELEDTEILMICFPFTDRFVEQVKNYKTEYNPKLTIINSSVEVGTTEKCGDHVVYSPIRGRHRPRLSDELRMFAKFIAGINNKDVQIANDYFTTCYWKTMITSDVKGLELCKLISNIHMGLEIAWVQEMDRILKKMGGEIETYKSWERTYNNGYKNLYQFHLMRPIMESGPIGGHCILECIEILSRQFDSPIFRFIKESNEKSKGIS